MVSDNFLDRLIGHRQLVDVSVVAYERVFGF